METMETTNTDRASWAAAALDTFASNAKKVPPITAEGAANLARFAAEQYAQAAGVIGLREQAETDLAEARLVISDVVADVLHHMDGAEPADALISAAYRVYQLRTGQITGAVAMIADDDQTGDAVEFLTALCHAAVALDEEDPIDMLTRGPGDFEEEAERVAHVRQARRERLAA
ncbi:hypothetical protein [Actinacidiphila soli]|uniref:hypothetical protein n=1 Tax=Actinacidiphila soli TaxID=2487275 RepID=UPI000FCB6244|nr:hypothetical protein [Actinacidiphila soli]